MIGPMKDVQLQLIAPHRLREHRLCEGRHRSVESDRCEGSLLRLLRSSSGWVSQSITESMRSIVSYLVSRLVGQTVSWAVILLLCNLLFDSG